MLLTPRNRFYLADNSGHLWNEALSLVSLAAALASAEMICVMMLRISVAKMLPEAGGGRWWLVMTATSLVLMTIHYAVHAIKLLYNYSFQLPVLDWRMTDY